MRAQGMGALPDRPDNAQITQRCERPRARQSTPMAASAQCCANSSFLDLHLTPHRAVLCCAVHTLPHPVTQRLSLSFCHNEH